MKKIVISGYHGFRNAGDDAILDSILRILRGIAAARGDTLDITVLSKSPAETAGNYGVRSIRRTNLLGIVSSIRSADLLISGGGSLLQDKTGYGLSVLYYLGVVLIAKLLGKPTVLYAHGIGPINKRLNRRLTKWVVNQVDLVTVRDEKSKEELGNLGVTKPPTHLTVDPVFYQHPVNRWGDNKAKKILAGLEESGPVIGISVRDWLGEKGFLEEIAKAADELARVLGAKIIFIPMFPDKDLTVSQEMVKLMKSPAQVLGESLTDKELLNLFSRLDLLIGVRLHSLIFAAVAGVPMVGIGYDPKIFSFLAQMGLRPAGDVHTLKAKELVQESLKVWQEREAIRGRLNSVVADFRKETISCGEMIYSNFFGQAMEGQGVIKADGGEPGEPKKLKVLHLISGGDTGGAKMHVLSLVKEMQKKIDVTLVCLMEGEFYRDGLAMGLDIRAIEQKQRYNLRVVRRLIHIIENEGVDILHCHGARANFIGAILKKFHQISMVTTIHSDYKLDFWGNFYKNLVYATLNAVALRSFDNFVAVSHNFKEMMVERRFPKDRIGVVYNGVDFETPLELRSRQEILADYGLEIPEEAKIIGIMGRLHPVKGHELFLEGAKQVIKQEPDTHFIAGGDGEEMDKLLALRDELGLQGRVHFIGRVYNPFEFFHAIDINTLTSYSESFPYVLLEGARLKKPTVSLAVGGIDRLIIDGKTGLLVKSRDPMEFALKLLQMLQDQELAHSLGEELYRHAQENYSLERMGQSQIEIYQDILRGKDN